MKAVAKHKRDTAILYAKNCPHRQKNTVVMGAYMGIIGGMGGKAKDFYSIDSE